MNDIVNQIEPYVVALVIQVLTLAIVFVKTSTKAIRKKANTDVDWSQYVIELDGQTYNLAMFRISKKGGEPNASSNEKKKKRSRNF